METCLKLYTENQNNLLKIKVEKTRWKPNYWLEETDIFCKTMDDKILGEFRSNTNKYYRAVGVQSLQPEHVYQGKTLKNMVTVVFLN